MDWFEKLLGGRTDRAGEEAVLVYIPLSDGDFGEEKEREALFELEDRLTEIIEDEAQVGEFDGNEIGGGEFILFLYGSDADALFAALEPELRRLDPPSGDFYAIKRHGPPDDGVREERIDLR
jgi:hypothetical protein